MSKCDTIQSSCLSSAGELVDFPLLAFLQNLSAGITDKSKMEMSLHYLNVEL